MLVLLVRHGQASFGDDDYDRLSPLGERQACSLGHWWAQGGDGLHGGPAAAWHGGLQRQQRTAELCLAAAAQAVPNGPSPSRAGAAGTVLRLDADWREYDHRGIFFAAHPHLRDPATLQAWMARPGDYPARFQAAWGEALSRWLSGRYARDYAETWADLGRRVQSALQRLAGSLPPAGSHAEPVAAVFTSAGPISAVLQGVLGLSDGEAIALQQDLRNTGVTRLRGGGDAPWQLVRQNDTAHLLAADVPASHR